MMFVLGGCQVKPSDRGGCFSINEGIYLHVLPGNIECDFKTLAGMDLFFKSQLNCYPQCVVPLFFPDFIQFGDFWLFL